MAREDPHQHWTIIWFSPSLATSLCLLWITMSPCRLCLDTILPAPWYPQTGCFISKSSTRALASTYICAWFTLKPLWFICIANIRGQCIPRSFTHWSLVRDCIFKKKFSNVFFWMIPGIVGIGIYWDVFLDISRPEHDGQHFAELIFNWFFT